ncbi:hypothetical protein L1987_05201 [Smallanthus sonchifolius]|uniref:Uncharacterized protein n=1 Tax=Smallanthus sonchifolius TaxID=185202 RepID=A0ACB9JUV7_9ASTR|nr:hypothetical protein L1987_05201 [Smallanthus sonchifolius]
MMETKLYSSRVFSPFHEESENEELSVLPRHAKVIVTGNDRTKSFLVGLQGVVKKVVGQLVLVVGIGCVKMGN